MSAETKPDVRDRTQILPPYSVVLHNDDYNEMTYVVDSLLKSVPSLSPERAVEIMFEAHFNGRAIVVTCPLELAELYQQRLCSRGLTATIEKA